MLPLLSFTVDADPKRVRLAVTGDIDLATADQLLYAIDDGASRSDAPDVELDMASVTFLDSAGIAVLVQAHRFLHAQHRRLVATRVPAHVMTVLQVTGVDVFLGAT